MACSPHEAKEEFRLLPPLSMNEEEPVVYQTLGFELFQLLNAMKRKEILEKLDGGIVKFGEIRDSLNLGEDSLRHSIILLVGSGFVARVNQGNHYTYHITDSGRNALSLFYEFTNKIIQ